MADWIAKRAFADAFCASQDNEPNQTQAMAPSMCSAHKARELLMHQTRISPHRWRLAEWTPEQPSRPN